MIRTKGEAGSGNIVEAVRHLRQVMGDIRALTVLPEEELAAQAKELRAPVDLVKLVAQNGKLPVPNFCRRRGGDTGRRCLVHGVRRRVGVCRIRDL